MAARTGIPIPVPIKVYDETIRVLKGAIQNAKLGRDEELQAIKRLDDQARRLERTASGPSVEAYHRGRACSLARSRRPLRVRLGTRYRGVTEIDGLTVHCDDRQLRDRTKPGRLRQ